jgi:hypothetical protein
MKQQWQQQQQQRHGQDARETHGQDAHATINPRKPKCTRGESGIVLSKKSGELKSWKRLTKVVSEKLSWNVG